MHGSVCTVCVISKSRGVEVDTSRSNVAWAAELGVGEASVRRHLKHPPTVDVVVTVPPDTFDLSLLGDVTATKFADRVIPLSEWLEDLRADGFDPDDFTPSYSNSAWGQQPRDGELITLYANRFSAVQRKRRDVPDWPVIQPATPVIVIPPLVSVERVPRTGLKCSLKAGDPQIGFRVMDDGTLDPFHDDAAMAVFVEACRLYMPEKITILGDFLDLPSQGKFAQEARFARTMQPALDRGHRFLAELRAACPDADIVVIEGNHDKRLQNSIEANALASFGLKRADMPDEWPVMSLPFLLRLNDLKIRYVDAYPAATDWDNDTTRNIHGTRANSKGSTTSQYSQELPHISTWVGHTHRAEITYKTVLGPRGEAIESYTANPGVLCRTDGSVPSVKGAIGADGVPVRVVEDWQAGFGILFYSDTESWPQVYRIKDGRAIVGDRIIRAD